MSVSKLYGFVLLSGILANSKLPISWCLIYITKVYHKLDHLSLYNSL